MLILCPHAAWYSTNGASLVWRLRRRISTVIFTCGWAWPARRFIWYWASGSKVHKNFKICDFLPWTPINRRAKFDAPSFILDGEIRNRTNISTQKNKQTVADISTPCLSAYRYWNSKLSQIPILLISLPLCASNRGFVEMTVYWTEKTLDRKRACIPQWIAIATTPCSE